MTTSYSNKIGMKIAGAAIVILSSFSTYMLNKIYNKVESIDTIKLDVNESRVIILNIVDKNKEQDVQIEKLENQIDLTQSQLLNHMLATYESENSQSRAAKSH